MTSSAPPLTFPSPAQPCTPYWHLTPLWPVHQPPASSTWHRSLTCWRVRYFFRKLRFPVQWWAYLISGAVGPLPPNPSTSSKGTKKGSAAGRCPGLNIGCVPQSQLVGFTPQVQLECKQLDLRHVMGKLHLKARWEILVRAKSQHTNTSQQFFSALSICDILSILQGHFVPDFLRAIKLEYNVPSMDTKMSNTAQDIESCPFIKHESISNSSR